MTTSSTLSRRHGIVIADQSSDLARKFTALVREWRRRSCSRIDLMRLNERELWDIRLSRADAEHEANKPFWQQ